jgi:hypothetical protein
MPSYAKVCEKFDKIEAEELAERKIQMAVAAQKKNAEVLAAEAERLQAEDIAFISVHTDMSYLDLF